MIAAGLAALALTAGGVEVTLTPGTVRKEGQVRIAVSGVPAQRASVRIVGAVASGGRWHRWVALRDAGHGSWWTILRAPGFLGVYPLQLRADGKVSDLGVRLEILPERFQFRPAFEAPEDVARWWVRTALRGATLIGVSTQQTGFYTHRDPRLNRLLRVSFSLDGSPHLTYLSVSRLSDGGSWRFVERARAP
jgi:hypothetical protein